MLSLLKNFERICKTFEQRSKIFDAYFLLFGGQGCMNRRGRNIHDYERDGLNSDRMETVLFKIISLRNVRRKKITARKHLSQKV